MSYLLEFLMPRLPPNSILIRLMVTQTNVWQSHLYFQPGDLFRTKTLEDDLNSISLLSKFYKGTRDTKTVSRNLPFLDNYRTYYHNQRPDTLVSTVGR